MSSEVDEKQQLIELILSNSRIEDKNIGWDAQKQFDLLVKIKKPDLLFA